jgi:hypothetical protein
MILLSVLGIAFMSGPASAQTITETFGSGANAFTMDFVTIGNPGNVADTTGSPNPAGSVAYTYNIGKYEVSRDMITKANAAGGLGITISDMISYGGNGVNRPATGISWYEAARFVNYLNTSSGSTAAYKFDGSGNFQVWSAGDIGYDSNNLFRNILARYVLPSRDEWYKSAYGGPNDAWYNYPTGSDSVPTAVASGVTDNTAVYNFQNGPADITEAGGLSPWGTMAQGGNVFELIETAYDGSNDFNGEYREIRGGNWNYYAAPMTSSFGLNIDPSSDGSLVTGFRVAMVPEPSTLSLLALGGVVVALRRRR